VDRVRAELKYGEQAARNLTKANQQRKGAVALYNNNVPLPSQYHWEKLSAFSDSLDRITRQIEDVDQYLMANEQQFVGARLTQHPKAFQQILGAQHAALCSLTARVAQLHSLCDELRDKYRKLKVKHTAADPSVFSPSATTSAERALMHYPARCIHRPKRHRRWGTAALERVHRSILPPLRSWAVRAVAAVALTTRCTAK
jgi:hypothetical protein